jgi:hypothetical protein
MASDLSWTPIVNGVGILFVLAAAFPLPASGERDRVRGNPELGCEHFQNAFEIAKNLVIPDSDHTIPEAGEIGVATMVRWIIGMLPAVDLNNEALLATDEVDVIRSKRLLPRKLQTAETAIAKRQP